MINSFQQLLAAAVEDALEALDAKDPLALIMAATHVLATAEPMHGAMAEASELASQHYPGLKSTGPPTPSIDAQLKSITHAVLVQELMRDPEIVTKLESLNGTVNSGSGIITFGPKELTGADQAAT